MIFKIESEFTTDIQSKAVQEIRYFEDLSQAIEKIFDRLLLNKATLESTSGHSRFVQAGCNNTLCFLMNTLDSCMSVYSGQKSLHLNLFLFFTLVVFLKH